MGRTFEELALMDIEQAVELFKSSEIHDGRVEISRWRDAHEILYLSNAYHETKDPSLILDVIYLCSLNDFPMPGWCAQAFINSYRDVKHYRVGSWDDAFKRPHSKGAHIGTKREYREKRFDVYRRIKDILKSEPGAAIDGGLFERVGRELGIGSKTKTAEYYYSVIRETTNHDADPLMQKMRESLVEMYGVDFSGKT